MGETTNRFSAVMQALLSQHETELLGLAQRLGHIMSVHAELVRITDGKLTTFRGESAYVALLGERDMIVTDLASWALGFYSKGGFLRKAQASGLKALERSWKYDVEHTPSWIEMNAEKRSEAFARLFPGAIQSGVPCPQDIDLLGAKLHDEFESLRDDRNAHRAHKYERDKKNATVAMLAPSEVAEHHATCRQLLADLRFLASNGSFGTYGYVPVAKPDNDDAQDAVDLVLLGGVAWILDNEPSRGHAEEDRKWWQTRAAYYKRLHAAHQSRGNRDDDPFNTPLARGK